MMFKLAGFGWRLYIKKVEAGFLTYILLEEGHSSSGALNPFLTQIPGRGGGDAREISHTHPHPFSPLLKKINKAAC